MTFDNLCRLGRTCLKEYRPHVNVLGMEEYNPSRGPIEIRRTYERTLASFDESEMRHEISKVLDQLVALKNGFVVSGPEFLVPPVRVESANVVVDNLCLTFTYGSDQKALTQILHIVCWYYPARV